MDKGKLVVIEGIDGSGKSTQVKLLSEKLQAQNITFETISFPRYKDNLYGQLIRRYLEGEFGGVDKVNPYFIALAYAGDRMLAKTLMEQWLSEGKMVIANRYTPSSFAHLGANLPEEQRTEFIDWVKRLEYQTNGIPEADFTILLTIDPSLGQKNVAGRHKDIHEEDLKHLQEAHRIYLGLAEKMGNWYVVDCMKGDQMRSPQDIYQEIVEILENKI